jgi:hypothetical protein
MWGEEVSMHLDPELDRSNRFRSDRLHPVIYGAMLALALLLVLAAWSFAVSGDTAANMAVVSTFAVISLAIPLVLFHIWRRRTGTAARERTSDWFAGDLELWQGRIRGADGALMALLPIAAVAFGMVLFAIVLHLAVG